MAELLWLIANIVMVVFIIKTIKEKSPDNKKKLRFVWLGAFAIAIILFFIIGAKGSNTDNQADTSSDSGETAIQAQPTEPEPTTDLIATETPTPTIAPRTPEEFEVFITPTGSFDGNGVVFEISTNLPDESVLMLSLSSGDYNTDTHFTAQTKVTVSNGNAISEGFSNKGAKLSGSYDLSISMSLPHLQTDAVRKYIGENGELMTGPLVVSSDYGDANVVQALFSVTVDKDISITATDDYSNTTFREEDEDTSDIDISSIAEDLSSADTELQIVKKTIQGYIDANYTFTSIDSIDVNPNLGTEATGDYIALVHLTWDQKNSGKTSRDMLDMYSQDMAVRIYSDLPEIQELAVFWTVPYLNNGTAKMSFERTSNGMRITDSIFDKNFN